MKLKHGNITEQIIGAAFEVYRILGYGFLEKVYQRAMQVELALRGLQADLEHRLNYCHEEREAGTKDTKKIHCHEGHEEHEVIHRSKRE